MIKIIEQPATEAKRFIESFSEAYAVTTNELHVRECENEYIIEKGTLVRFLPIYIDQLTGITDGPNCCCQSICIEACDNGKHGLGVYKIWSAEPPSDSRGCIDNILSCADFLNINIGRCKEIDDIGKKIEKINVESFSTSDKESFTPVMLFFSILIIAVGIAGEIFGSTTLDMSATKAAFIIGIPMTIYYLIHFVQYKINGMTGRYLKMWKKYDSAITEYAQIVSSGTARPSWKTEDSLPEEDLALLPLGEQDVADATDTTSVR